MKKEFKKLMREQIQKRLNNFKDIAEVTPLKEGWIRTIRNSLDMSMAALAKRVGCTKSNIVAIEQSEQKGTVSIKTLENIAQGLNCRLVYYLIPEEPLDKIIEKRAREVAKKQIKMLNNSMKLEQQGLTLAQLKRQEDDLTNELLAGNLKNIWD